MIIARISDGLGNQMFQYAFGRQLQEIYQMPLVLETFRYGHTEKMRKFGLGRLNISFSENRKDVQACRIATGIESFMMFLISVVKWRWAYKILKIPRSGLEGYTKMIKMGMYGTLDIITFYPFEKTMAKNIRLHGGFQSEKYFHDIAPMIKRELRVKQVSSDLVRNLGEKMMLEDSVCIQVRRGDFVGHRIYDVCTEGYFQRAVDYIKTHVEHPVLYVFSNSEEDLEWIRKQYSFLSEAHFVTEGKDEFDDLYLMYHRRHHIISNSTFGWWGSYLKLQEGITVCPEKWMRNSDMKQDIQQEDWIKIPV